MLKLRTWPLASKLDTLEHARNLMAGSSLFEIPVVNEELLGTVHASALISVLDKAALGSMSIANFLDKNCIITEVKQSPTQLAKIFLQSRRCIACVQDSGKYIGYVARIDLLSCLLNYQRSVEALIEQEFVEVDARARLGQLIKEAFQHKPVVVVKDGKPCCAYLPEELQFMAFVSDYVARKLQRDFETLRAEDKELLRQRLDQDLLAALKDKPMLYYPTIRVEQVIEPLTLQSGASVAQAAQLMLERKRYALATPKGPLTDLSLLLCL